MELLSLTTSRQPTTLVSARRAHVRNLP